MKAISTLLFLSSATFCLAQDHRTEFNAALQTGDTTKQKEVLAKWEKADNKNAELFTCYFNYYFHKSKRELLSFTGEQPKGESLLFKDSTGKEAYIGSELHFDHIILQKGLNKIDEGIKLYPDRLDMRFGKIYVLGEINDWKRFTDEIVTTIQFSAKNKNNWTWTNNIKKENGEKFFLDALQDYQVKLYNTADDSLLPYMRTIAEEVLKLHPDHIESLSNLGITFLVTNRYDEAIAVFLRAEKVAPKDKIVLGNIAEAYRRKGEKKKAIEYFEKVIKQGDEQMSEYARKQIQELSH